MSKEIGVSFDRIISNQNIYKKPIIIKTKRNDKSWKYALDGSFNTDEIILKLE